MKLSVIIVNYNVKYFLEQCLISVFKSARSIDVEVFVVDNASADGSCQMVRQRFPSVILIENKINSGFSVANNQAIRIARGEFILLLNPDTVVEEDTFEKCIHFMASHPEAGGMAVKMIDGKGRFLPESKRSLPSPMVSFYKIIGLARLFPRSRIFGRYHLGHLDKNQTHEIDILPGAFMFLRKSVLDNVGLLDEDFFMYGEDIDLSYRILKSGLKNYYYPDTKIIHYKGESTKKGSLNYVITFYKAMAIFAKKHFSRNNAKFYILLIYIAIIFRALLSAIKRAISNFILPILDVSLIVAGLLTIIQLWELNKFHSNSFYPTHVVVVMVTIYTGIWVISNWIFGAYDKHQKLLNSIKSVALGTIAILVIYALMPLEYRFSRIIILLGGVWAIISNMITRLVLSLFERDLLPEIMGKKNIAIIGNENEAKRVSEMLDKSKREYRIAGCVSPEDKILDNNQICTIDQLDEFIRVNNVDEVIFSGNDLTSQQIINLMLRLSESGVEYKIAPKDSMSIIGSNFVNAPENLFSPDFNTIGAAPSRRSKRLFDLFMAIIILLLFPLWIFIKPRLYQIIKSSFYVLLGLKTWIGYIPSPNNSSLPVIKPSVFNISSGYTEDLDQINTTNLLYARNYKVIHDFNYLITNISAF